MSVVLTGLLGIIHNYRPEMNVVRVSMRLLDSKKHCVTCF